MSPSATPGPSSTNSWADSRGQTGHTFPTVRQLILSPGEIIDFHTCAILIFHPTADFENLIRLSISFKYYRDQKNTGEKGGLQTHAWGEGSFLVDNVG